MGCTSWEALLVGAVLVTILAAVVWDLNKFPIGVKMLTIQVISYVLNWT